MKIHCRVTVTVLVSTFLVVPVARAAAPPVQLVVTGGGNSHADVTLRAALVLPKRPTTFSVRGCGRYGGLYIEPLNRAKGSAVDDFGLLDPAVFDYTSLYYRQPVALGQAALGDAGDDGNVRLPAGRYRIHLFGEGAACQVRTPVLRGLSRTLTVRPGAPTSVQYADARLRLPGAAPGGPHAGTATFPVTVGNATYVVAATHHWQREPADGPSPLQRADACLDVVPAATCSPARTSSYRVQSYERRRHPDGSMYRAVNVYEYAPPGSLPPGSVHAKAFAVSPPGDWTAAAAMLGFDIG